MLMTFTSENWSYESALAAEIFIPSSNEPGVAAWEEAREVFAVTVEPLLENVVVPEDGDIA